MYFLDTQSYPLKDYSPTPDLAKKSGPKDGKVFKVEFQGGYKICQLKQYNDSKDHPECRSLRALVLKKLGQKWLDSDLISKTNAGRLFIPCLQKEEVEAVFDTDPILKDFKAEVYDSIRYWEDISLIEKPNDMNSTGELFFHTTDGYYLRPL